jgi:hypothetical protein
MPMSISDIRRKTPTIFRIASVFNLVHSPRSHLHLSKSGYSFNFALNRGNIIAEPIKKATHNGQRFIV